MNERAVTTTSGRKPTFSMMISTEGYQRMISSALEDEQRRNRFIASITSAVAVNPALQECTPQTILSGALLGESLNLSPSPQLGQYYLVPFKNNRQGVTEAQFCLGYKGYIQLALRSGYYKKLNVLSIKEGELVRFDPLNEEIEVKMIEDEREREAAKTAGYYAFFEYMNGFRKALYWSRDKMEAHALRFSKGYAAKKGYTFWEKDFDAMAYKTMLRQLISKWGVMSTEMQDAVAQDMRADMADMADEQTPLVEPASVITEAAQTAQLPAADNPATVSLDDL